MRSLTGAVALFVALNAVVSTASAAGMATQRIAGGRFAAVAARAANALPADPNAALEPAFTVPDQTVAAGSLTLHVQAAVVTPSYVNVPIEVDVDGRAVRTVYVGYRVARYVQTAVASHDIAPGTVLAASDLTMGRTAFVGHHANGIDVLVGRRVANAFTAGSAVYIEQTQTNMIVKPGATVIFIVRDGDVQLVADVVARNGGGLGDQVFVYNASTNKTLSGTVTGPNRVELVLDSEGATSR